MKKGSVIYLIIAVIAINFIYERMWPREKPDTASQTDDTNYSLKPTENSWPSLETAPSELAGNLLAPNYYVVLDGSGSMGDRKCSGNKTKLEAAKDALEVFVQQMPGSANMGLYVFDANGRNEVVPLAGENQAEFRQAVRRSAAGSDTPLFTAISAGYRALTLQATAQLGYGEYHLVVVTDGEANQGEDPRPAVKRLLTESPVVLHTIGFCIGDRHSLNQPGLVDYRAADDPQSLQRNLQAVLAEAPNFDMSTFKEKD
jgi:hypothetical protein